MNSHELNTGLQLISPNRTGHFAIREPAIRITYLNTAGGRIRFSFLAEARRAIEREEAVSIMAGKVGGVPTIVLTFVPKSSEEAYTISKAGGPTGSRCTFQVSADKMCEVLPEIAGLSGTYKLSFLSNGQIAVRLIESETVESGAYKRLQQQLQAGREKAAKRRSAAKKARKPGIPKPT